MYQSPIEIIHDNMRMEIEGEVYKAVQRVGVNVDKEELLKALQYDRGQYLKGYGDGYAKAIEEFTEKVVAELEKEKEIHTEHFRISLYKDYPEIKKMYEKVCLVIDKAISIVRGEE